MTPRTYADPSRLFTIRLPEGFTRDEGVKALVFRHPDIDGAVTVSCMRHRLDAAGPDVFESLPGRERMSNVRRGQADGLSVAYGEYEGELQNRPEYWRWWTLQRGPVCVVASFNGAPEDAETWREEVDALVAGIQITASPPQSVEEFTQTAARVYARALEKPVPGILKPLELQTGQNAVLRLDNAYVSYLHAHDRNPETGPEEMLSDWFEQLWGTDTRALEPFEETRALLYPVVKPWGFARETQIPLLRRTLLEHELELMIALDTGRTLRFLSHEDVARWEGVSEEDVFFYARENLLALSEELQLQALAGPDGRPRAVIVATGDGHDAARLTLPTLFSKLAEVLGENMLVGVPNRDFMIVLNADEQELVESISRQVKVDSQTRPYSISGKLYRLTAEGLAHFEGA